MHTGDSDQTGQMPRLILSLRWAHMSFCWFCHAAAQIVTLLCLVDSSILSIWSSPFSFKGCQLYIFSCFKYFDIKPCIIGAVAGQRSSLESGFANKTKMFFRAKNKR